ncbi:hypothetical protein Xsto_00073 [Xenorhabdus stockiae]|uniref:Uncharacterized protein n=1 Tax=Xenorhabdus stockiae TaxID=351614 RepID=A0A2D0KWI8_9GAMM|nr:hypothetical protein Xsto_00073 [Xenorhabdus stockiae]
MKEHNKCQLINKSSEIYRDKIDFSDHEKPI